MSNSPILPTSNGNNEPAAAGHAGWCLYRLDCERKAASPRSCSCGSRSLAESLRQALKWDWSDIPRDALGNVQHALRLALEAHGNETECVAVAGDSISTTLAMFQHKCSVHIADEQVKPNPNNALIDTLCEAIRLCRENERLARAPLQAHELKGCD